MASTSSCVRYRTATRLQKATEKRRSEELLEEEAQLKRQKTIFAPTAFIGPRDIVVTSNILYIKPEENVTCGSSVKQENLKVEPLSTNGPRDSFGSSKPFQVKIEEESCVVVKLEECLDLEESPFAEQCNETLETMEQFVKPVNESTEGNGTWFGEEDNLEEVASKPRSLQFSQNYIKLLQALVNQKDKEIKLLLDLIRELDVNATDKEPSNDGSENGHINTEDSSPNHTNEVLSLDNRQVVIKLNSDLREKEAKIKTLSVKMRSLQYKIISQMDNSLHISTNPEPPKHGSFEMVLPFLYTKLDLEDMLTCRGVSQNWQTAVDKFFDTPPSQWPLNEDARWNKEGKSKLERISTGSDSPFNKLTEAYRFSDLARLNMFTTNRKGRIIGSAVWLDNINIDCSTSADIMTRFLTTVGIQIKYLKIGQFVESPDLNIKLLVDCVKLCLAQLPNLVGFTIVIGSSADKTLGPNALGNEILEYWQNICTFPKLDNLKSLVIDVENFLDTNKMFLNIVVKSLIHSYSKQLKQLSIVSQGTSHFEVLDAPNLKQLSIPRKSLCDKMKFRCKNVKKCIITSHGYNLKHKHILQIETVFPKLVCLGFNFKSVGGEFHDFLWTSSTPKLPHIRTLVLENCGAVKFTLLSCFPNLRYLKLINKPTDKVLMYQKEDKVLHVTKLCQGKDLYNLPIFWEHFPNILRVDLEFSGDSTKNVKPKFSTWRRERYVKYWCKNIE